jgi:hypothetical protein
LQREGDQPRRTGEVGSKWVRCHRTSGTHLLGRTKIEGRNNTCFDIR